MDRPPNALVREKGNTFEQDASPQGQDATSRAEPQPRGENASLRVLDATGAQDTTKRDAR